MDIGGKLKEAREARGLTVTDVANELKIRTCYVEAMEDNKFMDLPPDIYRFGFIRTYADFLEIDVEQVMQALSLQLSSYTVDVAHTSDEGFNYQYIIIALVVIVLGVFVWMMYG